MDGYLKFLISGPVGKSLAGRLQEIIHERQWDVKESGKLRITTLEQAFIWLLSSELKSQKECTV